MLIEWGIPESDGGAPIEGYVIAIKDVSKTMWMEVGQVGADDQKLTVKELQDGHEYLIRIFARNEIGLSEALESDEGVKIANSKLGEWKVVVYCFGYLTTLLIRFCMSRPLSTERVKAPRRRGDYRKRDAIAESDDGNDNVVDEGGGDGRGY